MKTIEERAKLNLQYERGFCGYNLSDNMVCRAYVKGATEQKKIDINKACEWLFKNYGQFDGKVEDFVADFRKAMELC